MLILRQIENWRFSWSLEQIQAALEGDTTRRFLSIHIDNLINTYSFEAVMGVFDNMVVPQVSRRKGGNFEKIFKL